MKRYIMYICVLLLFSTQQAKSNKCSDIAGIKARIATFENNALRILNTIVSELTNTACAAIPISNGQHIINEPGNYCLTQNIKGPLAINSSNVALNLNNFDFNGSIVINGSQVAVYNGTITGSSLIGILIPGGLSNIYLSNLTISGYSLSGIRAPFANNNIILENICSYNNFTGAAFFNQTNLTIKNSTFNNNSNLGLNIETCTDIFVDNCQFNNNPFALTTGTIGNTNMVIANCIAKQSVGQGFNIRGTNILLLGCCSLAAGFIGFAIERDNSVAQTTAALVDCIALGSQTAGFSINSSNINFWLENCISNFSTNDGFNSVANVTGTFKGCSAINNGRCGFNDVTGSTIRYVSNYAADNGNNYCVDESPDNGAPYNAVAATSVLAGYWNNVYLP